MWQGTLNFYGGHVLVGVALLVISALPVRAAEQERWVHGSWVNVRQSSEANSAVITQITTNTPVKLLAQAGKSCEIAWGEEQKGFVPCRLLGEKPLKLADVAWPVILSDPKASASPQYSPPRAFWIAPSAATLFEAGQYFQRTMLPQKQRDLEQGYTENGECCADGVKAPRLVRYAIPEFEAMKALLAKGIVAAPDRDPPLLTCQRMQQARASQPNSGQKNQTVAWNEWRYPSWENYPHLSPMVDDCRIPELPTLHLPTIRPSYFKDDKGILPGNSHGGAEQISAHFGIVERGRITGGPKWERDYDITRYTGAWDIGRYELKLDKPVVEHVIGRTGLVGAYQWSPFFQITPNGPSGDCAEGLQKKRAGRTLLQGYPAVKDALLWFQAPTALPLKKVKVTSHVERVPQAKIKSATYSGLTFERVAVYEVDLDGDGIADFVSWDLWSPVFDSSPLLTIRMVYVNINGEWHPFDRDAYQECT